jgi:DNA-binding response OmpR family regulator
MSNSKILVVEDETSIQNVIRTCLENEHFQGRGAAGVNNGISRFA